MDHRSDGHGARPLESDGVRSDGFWRRARPAAHASGSEAVATLATAGRQDGAAGAGAHPQTEAVGLVPTAVVRLERALAQRGSLHSRGLADKSDHRVVSCESRQLRSTSTAHLRPCGLSWTCGTGRHRFRPANGTRWPSTGSIRTALAGRAARCAFRSDTPKPGDIARGSLWTTVDPRARELLASMVPGSPNSTDRPSWPVSGFPIAVTIFRARNCGHKGPNRQSLVVVLTSNRDNLRTLHNLWTKVWSLGIRVCATAQPRDGSATGRGCRTEHRCQPGKSARGPLAGHRRQPPSEPAGLADLQQAVDACREHRRGRRTERVHPQPARGPAAHPHRGHPQRAARQAGPARGQRGPHPGARGPRPAGPRLARGRQPGAHQRSGSHPRHRRVRGPGLQRPVEPGDRAGEHG